MDSYGTFRWPRTHGDRPQAIRSQYLSNKQAIDGYFNLVDIEVLVNEFGGDAVERISVSAGQRIKNNVPGFLLGTATGALTLAFILNRRQGK